MDRSIQLRAASISLLSMALVAACGKQGPPTLDHSAAVHEAKPAIPAELIVSTNEPFWHARANADTVSLIGAGLIDAGIDERQFDLRSSRIENGSRVIRASDAAGRIEMRIESAPCRDSMSGASFPFRATLFIDNREPIHGCARPASMPAPQPGP